MHTFSWKKFYNLCRFYQAMKNRAEYSSLYPPSLCIETSAECNLRCNKCPVGRERVVDPAHKFMDLDLYKRIIDEIKPYTRRVCLSYFGEPFLHQQFFDFVHYAKRNHLSVEIFSNGILLDDPLIHQIIESKIDSIFFSVDCLASEYKFFAKMKQLPEEAAKAHIEKLIAGIKKLCAQKRQAKSRLQIVAVHMNSPESTPYSVYQKYWKAYDVATCSGGVIDWAGEVKRVEVTRKKSTTGDCWFPYYLAISANGAVGMCCTDFNNRIQIGNAREQKIIEIYNSPKIRSIRKQLANKNFKDLPCEHCRFEDYGIPDIKNLIIYSVRTVIRDDFPGIVDSLSKVKSSLTMR